MNAGCLYSSRFYARDEKRGVLYSLKNTAYGRLLFSAFFREVGKLT